MEIISSNDWTTGSFVSCEVTIVHISEIIEGKSVKRRDVYSIDEQRMFIKITLWKTKAEEFCEKVGSKIKLKKFRVSEFHGKCLSSVGFSEIVRISEEIEIPIRLLGILGGIDLIDIKTMRNRASVRKAYSFLKASIESISADISYRCCMKCKKKVIDDSCTICSNQLVGQKMKVTFFVSDSSGICKVTAFEDSAVHLFATTGHLSAEEILQKDNKSIEKLIEQIEGKTILFKIGFKLISFDINSSADNEESMFCSNTSMLPIVFFD